MVLVNKIDSNITGLAYAEEAILGSLPGENGQAGTPVWRRLEPNSYRDFGGELITRAPNPINPSRQRRKGVPLDLNAAGGFNHNLAFYNLQDLLQGLMYADIRKKAEETVTAVVLAGGQPDEYQVASTTGFYVGALVKGTGFTNSANNGVNEVTVITADTSVEVAEGSLVAEASPPADAKIDVVGVVGDAGDIDVDASGDFPLLTSTTLDFTTLGLVPGQWIYVGGDAAGTAFSNSENNGFKRIRAIAANAITVDKSVSSMTTEASTTETIHLYFGDVLKNELGSLIKRRSYNVERTLGASDTATPNDIQSEVLVGAVPSEAAFNIPRADFFSVDFSFLATDAAQRDGTTGPKQSSVKDPLASTVYNTTSDFSRIKMATIGDSNEAPDPLFAFITEMTLTVNNNLEANKAVGVFGAFDVSAGTFQVSASITAYFASVAATKAVRDNSNVTMDVILAKENLGMAIDLPLIALGDGRLNVEQDQPITLPLSMDAATSKDIDENLDYTLMFTFFNYLPTAAM